MFGKAIDLDSVVGEDNIDAMRAAGIVAAIRYTKNNSLEESLLLSRNGIKVVSVFEALGDRYSSFNYSQGIHDASLCLQQIAKFHQPKDTPIYFCGCDFDASNVEVENGILAYFVGLNRIMPQAGFKIGVYGNGYCCSFLQDIGYVANTWLWAPAKSNGTANYLASNKWSIHQHIPTTEFGLSVDPDDLNGNYGGWTITA